MQSSSSNIYLDEFKRVACRAFSMWHREPASPSSGSFDRQYWGWKKKDFSDTTLQFAVKLTVEYAHMTSMTSTLPLLLEEYVNYCKGVQLKNGSFDQCYPNEHAPGVVYDLLSTFIYLRESPYLHSHRAQNDLDEIMERAVGFALKTDEKHGDIANHIAEYAYELFNYASYSGDKKAYAKGEEHFEKLLSLFDDSEGWFEEYHGPDAGYQTRTLRFLVKCALLLDKSEIWKMIQKATNFIDNMLMPDGSIHPMLGSRSTALLYPSAFELLAVHDSIYEGLAVRVRKSWENSKVPIPSWLDFDNAIRLADDAREAADALASNSNRHNKDYDTIRLGQADQRIELPNAGITIIHKKQLIIYIGSRLGGIVVVYGKHGNERWKLLYEDSGYLLRSSDNKAGWISRMPGTGCLKETSENRLLIQAYFYKSLHDEVTPTRLVLLRLLCMTFLRFQWIGDLFRKVVVRHLMSRRNKIPISLLREIKILPDSLRVTDRICDRRKKGNTSRSERLFRCRRITGTHMASARYFQVQELEDTMLDWIREIPLALDRETMNEVEISIEGYNIKNA